MFNAQQISFILKKYAQDVLIIRQNEKIIHKGILVLGCEDNKRYDFGITQNQTGFYIYDSNKPELLDGDIIQFGNDKFILSKTQQVYFTNKILYKKVFIEKL